jgi:hypothetical protein
VLVRFDHIANIVVNGESPGVAGKKKNWLGIASKPAQANF